jgi:hypothetical protein
MRYLIVVGLLVLPLEALAQLGGRANPTDPADRRVAQALRAAGYFYRVDDNGNYIVTVRFRVDNRTQLVWIASSTREIAGAEVRQVCSPAYVSTKPLSASLARRLLKENAGTGIGYWAAAETEGMTLVLFCTQVSADADPTILDAAIQAVAATADELEKELLGSDDL